MVQIIIHEKSNKRIWGMICTIAVLCAIAMVAPVIHHAQCADLKTDLWDRLKTFHGDLCPGSIMGARMGLAAKDSLLKAGGTGRIKATYYSLSCPVDGIQVAAGTTIGGGNLKVINKNEHRLVLKAEGNGKHVEARLTKLADEKGSVYRKLKKQAKSLPDNSPERETIEKMMNEIVEWFKTAPDSQVVDVRVSGIKP